MKALLVIDIQNDFMPAGALGVPRGDEVIPLANRLMPRFELVVATQDWHPADHKSFAANHPGRAPGQVIDLDGLKQTLWPVHCVRGTRGAEFVPGLETRHFARVFQKGTNPSIDSYSGFFDNGHRQSTGLSDYLRECGVDEIYLLGLATDYCVRWSALDARGLGFRTTVVEDGCRGVELDPGDVRTACDEMRSAGVEFAQSGALTAVLERAAS